MINYLVTLQEAQEAERRPLVRVRTTEGRSELTVMVGFFLR